MNTQVFSQSFDFYLRTENEEYFSDAYQDIENNYYLRGGHAVDFTWSEPLSTFLLKIDENGQLQSKLELSIDQNGRSFFGPIWIDSGLNIYLIGLRVDTSTGIRQINIWKYDKDFNLIWDKDFGGLAELLSVSNVGYKENTQELYFAGWEYNGASYRSYIGIVDLNGDSVLQKYYDFGGRWIPFSNVVITDSNAFVSIPSDTNFFKVMSHLIVFDSKLDIDTVVPLTGKANNLNNEVIFSNWTSFIMLNDSSFLMAGMVDNFVGINIDNSDFCVQKRNKEYSEDTSIVRHTYNIREQPGLRNLSKNGSRIYGGILSKFNKNALLISNEVSEFYLARLSENGDIIDDHFYTNNSYLTFYGVLATNDGGALMYGSTYLEGYNGPSERDAYALKVDSNGNANITPAGINSFVDVASGFKMYPNPVNDELNIQMLASGTGSVEILVYNGTGNLVYKDSIVGNDIKLNTTSYTSGMYFVVVRTEDSVYKKRLIKR